MGYLTGRQLATELGLSPRTIEKWTRTRPGFPVRRFGTCCRYLLEDVVAFLDHGAAPPPPPRIAQGDALELSTLISRAPGSYRSEANELRAVADRHGAATALRSPQADRIRLGIKISERQNSRP
jgi:hypothetical protein